MANKNGRKYVDPPKDTRKAESVNIRRAENGFSVSCYYPAAPRKKDADGDTDSLVTMGSSSKDTVFESAESLLEHLKRVL